MGLVPFKEMRGKGTDKVRKPKQKFKSAEAAQKERVLRQEWEAKYGEVPKKRKPGFELLKVEISGIHRVLKYQGELGKLAGPAGSRPDPVAVDGVQTSKHVKQYTGTKMKGTATMHKSNEVPVFSEEEAIEISRMRRG